MCPFQAISFLSLHASFPSCLYLVEKKTVITKCAITVNEYREISRSSMHKIHTNVMFMKLPKNPTGQKTSRNNFFYQTADKKNRRRRSAGSGGIYKVLWLRHTVQRLSN
jgi:hypothetical protein